jgi:hypothetical protein
MGNKCARRTSSDAYANRECDRMAGMPDHRKVRPWIQGLALGVGTLLGAFVNDKWGGNWSIWHKIGTRLACLIVVIGVVSILLTRRSEENSN